MAPVRELRVVEGLGVPAGTIYRDAPARSGVYGFIQNRNVLAIIMNASTRVFRVELLENGRVVFELDVRN